MNTNSGSLKIQWLSVLQGWSMLLVVIGHITLTNNFQDPAFPITAEIEKIIYTFHMPLFMFISGYLLYLSKIQKNKSYSEVIIDKLKRLGIPFLFFTCLTILPKVLLAPLMNSPVSLNWNYFIDTFLLFKINPLGEMWFIISLFILMLLYPIYKLSLKGITGIILFTTIALICFFYFPTHIALFQLSHVMYMLVFFYLGIVFSDKHWIAKFHSYKVFGICLTAFIITNMYISYSLINNIVGICFSISLCTVISKTIPNLFSSFRNYTYQIFLLGIFFQMLVRYLYIKLNSDLYYIPCYILSIIVALYLPILISKTIQKINYAPLSMCFGLK